VQLIKRFQLPKKLKAWAEELEQFSPQDVRDVKNLRMTLMAPNWRANPVHVDIPSNPQIFGQIAHEAGLEAILYRSKMSDKQNCLAVFCDNFQNSSSVIEIDGERPVELKHPRVDSITWRSFVEFIN